MRFGNKSIDGLFAERTPHAHTIANCCWLFGWRQTIGTDIGGGYEGSLAAHAAFVLRRNLVSQVLQIPQGPHIFFGSSSLGGA